MAGAEALPEARGALGQQPQAAGEQEEMSDLTFWPSAGALST